ncbi:hypothetical protein HK098_002414 [Nowakowskiella sp. JEL0407]|nr:hypothetical protein HK098_002414 [Nowakowskiella sp. JEL0407]
MINSGVDELYKSIQAGFYSANALLDNVSSKTADFIVSGVSGCVNQTAQTITIKIQTVVDDMFLQITPAKQDIIANLKIVDGLIDGLKQINSTIEGNLKTNLSLLGNDLTLSSSSLTKFNTSFISTTGVASEYRMTFPNSVPATDFSGLVGNVDGISSSFPSLKSVLSGVTPPQFLDLKNLVQIIGNFSGVRFDSLPGVNQALGSSVVADGMKGVKDSLASFANSTKSQLPNIFNEINSVWSIVSQAENISTGCSLVCGIISGKSSGGLTDQAQLTKDIQTIRFATFNALDECNQGSSTTKVAGHALEQLLGTKIFSNMNLTIENPIASLLDPNAPQSSRIITLRQIAKYMSSFSDFTNEQLNITKIIQAQNLNVSKLMTDFSTVIVSQQQIDQINAYSSTSKTTPQLYSYNWDSITSGVSGYPPIFSPAEFQAISILLTNENNTWINSDNTWMQYRLAGNIVPQATISASDLAKHLSSFKAALKKEVIDSLNEVVATGGRRDVVEKTIVALKNSILDVKANVSSLPSKADSILSDYDLFTKTIQTFGKHMDGNVTKSSLQAQSTLSTCANQFQSSLDNTIPCTDLANSLLRVHNGICGLILGGIDSIWFAMLISCITIFASIIILPWAADIWFGPCKTSKKINRKVRGDDESIPQEEEKLKIQVDREVKSPTDETPTTAIAGFAPDKIIDEDIQMQIIDDSPPPPPPPLPQDNMYGYENAESNYYMAQEAQTIQHYAELEEVNVEAPQYMERQQQGEEKLKNACNSYFEVEYVEIPAESNPEEYQPRYQEPSAEEQLVEYNDNENGFVQDQGQGSTHNIQDGADEYAQVQNDYGQEYQNQGENNQNEYVENNVPDHQIQGEKSQYNGEEVDEPTRSVRDIAASLERRF